MRATEAYGKITARSLGGQSYDWIIELVDRFGDERVALAIEEDGRTGKPTEKLLGRVRDRLAKEDAMRRPTIAPAELSGRELLAMVRGETERPPGPFIWEVTDLTPEEYLEVMAWSSRRYGAIA